MFAMRLLGSKLLSAGEHREALVAAGFSDIEVFENDRKGWLCVVGRRDPGVSGANPSIT